MEKRDSKKVMSPKKRKAVAKAKKVMDLRWAKGITLKEAWAQVHNTSKKASSKKASSKKASSKKVMSPKKLKAAAKAKKVMDLRWAKGITLKEAWAQVHNTSKKASFGMGPCPQGFEPNQRYAANKGQRVCIKECSFYQMRNPETNRCKNMVMNSGLTSELPKGYERGPTGRLRKICLPGYYRDPVSGRCRRIKTILQPLIAPSLMDFGEVTGTAGTSWQMNKNARGHPMSSFGKKCGFGSCYSCGIN